MAGLAQINPERFSAFHRRAKIDTFDICAKCGGKCEVNKIGSLMPGELEYIAYHTGHSTDAFRNLYLDGIQTNFGVIDVLKLKPGCPFLATDYHCTISGYKPVLCEAYPVVFQTEDARVNFFLDTWCPIVHGMPDISMKFESLTTAGLADLHAPLDWFRAVAQYDHLCVDYLYLQDIRGSDMNYRVFTLNEVLSSECET